MKMVRPLKEKTIKCMEYYSKADNMELLLINPFFKERGGRFGYQISVPPLSLCFIGTYVKEHSDCEVEIVDPIPQRLSTDQVLKKVEEADFVGLICYTYNRHQCFDFAKKVKETNPYCKLIVGGAHVIDLDEKILQYYPFIDVVCRGEGEETVLEIVKGKPYSGILGITWSNNGEIIKNPDRPFMANIDSFYCDFSLLPDFDRYRPDIDVPKEIRSLRTAHIVASRGCPFNCTFCGSSRWKRKYRSTSPNKLVERIKDLVNAYGIEYIQFHDDLLTLNREYILKFCRLLKDNKLDIKFRLLTRGDVVSKEIFKALKEAGCVAVGIGVESGSDKVLHRLNKNITIEKVLRAIEILDDLDFWKIGFFMISLPEEKEEDYVKSLEVSKYFEVAHYNPLVVFPGTPLYAELKQKGEIADDLWFDPMSPMELYYCRENFPSAEFNIQEIDRLVKYADYYHTFNYPKALIDKYGLVKGSLALLKSAMDKLSQGKVSETYLSLKEKYLYRG
jgi:magnesium-protoporphyrin IX monomethyl ester (oxidative) cyclase